MLLVAVLSVAVAGLLTAVSAILADRNAALKALVEKYIALSLTDELTGLRNLRAFDSEAARVMAEAKRHNHDTAVFYIDIDNFKLVNDARGHHIGDRVLVLIASLLMKVSRVEDVTARIGGDEFALILPETDVEGAISMAERFLTEVRSDRELVEFGVTASVGISSLEQSGEDDLLPHADVAMYKAKGNGGNCYWVFAGSEGLDG